jgi:ABC-2 type transport system permease protein
VTDHALETVVGTTGAGDAAVSGSAWRQVAWRQYRIERKMFWRNPSAAFFNFVLPLLFLALFGAIAAGDKATLRIIVPGIAGMSVMSTTFTALAYNLTALRENGVLKRIRGTPMPTSAYLAALSAHAVTNAALQIGIVTVAGKLIFGLEWPADWVSLVLWVALGVVCFASLGVALSHAIPNFESAPAYVNAVFLPVIAISGVFYDANDAPQFLKDIASALPLRHLIDGLSGAMVTGDGITHHGGGLLVLALWTVAGLLLAIRGFSWDSRREG